MQKDTIDGRETQTILDRVCLLYAIPEGRGRPPALAKVLGAPLPTVKSWFARGVFPYKHIEAICADTGASFEWVATGGGNQPKLPQIASVRRSVLHPAEHEPEEASVEADDLSPFFALASKEIKKSATVAGPGVVAGPSLAPVGRSTERNPSATVAGQEAVAGDDFQPLAFTVQTDPLPYKVTEQRSRYIRAGEPTDRQDAYAKALIAGGAPGPGVLPLAGDGTPLLGGFVMAPPPTPSGAPLVIPVRYPDNQQRDFEVLPTFRGAASAGLGLENAVDAELDQAGYIAIDRAWMRANWGRAGNGFASVLVAGDSMEPTLSNGETIVVDTTVDRADASAIYVIRSGLDFLVKRVHRQLDGTLIIKGDNPAYEPEVVHPKQSHTIEILGRMVWPRVRR